MREVEMAPVARTTLQTIAAGWCLLNAAVLTLLQFGGFPHPPLPLYLVFTGVWLFGAAMLWRFPVFGGVGTAIYGAFMGLQILLMHGGDPLNLAVSASSFVAAGLAAAFLAQRRRSR